MKYNRHEEPPDPKTNPLTVILNAEDEKQQP